MKSLPNSSPSSASSTSYISNSFENNFFNSKRATSGCFRGVLRRFLCFNSLPTHPSDHLKEASNEYDYKYCTNGMENADASATPGLVARLMGLDSMPMTDLQMSLKSVRRCRSMDFGREVELKQGKGRHVKGTLSFRDAPAYLELENEEFFILSFEGGDENNKLGSKTRKSDLDLSEKKPRRTENKRRQSVQENIQVSDKKQLQSRLVTHRNSKDPSKVLCPIKNYHENSQSLKVVKTPDRGRLRKKKKKKQNCSPVKKIETECDSENSSPVSVLDFAEFPIEFEVPTSVKNSRLTSSNSRRTLFEELESYKKSSSLISNRLIVDDLEVKKTEDKCAIFWKKDYQSQNYAEMWGQVCKFAEKDMRQTKWMMYSEIWDLEEITTDIGFQILDQLLLELVDQVSCL